MATIEKRATVAKILAHLGLPVAPPQPSAARPLAWLLDVRERAPLTSLTLAARRRLTTRRRGVDTVEQVERRGE